VRALIARAWLGSRGVETIGSVVLHSHQRAAASRLSAMIRNHGGAMLADPVGLGKTYTALAVARDARQLLVVAPAALRPMWADALTSTGMRADFVSYQGLSRGRAPAAWPDFVIADEAHHLRNPTTSRYRAMARLCAAAPVLLLSATPVHNRTDDLRAQLALFLGQQAWALPDIQLSRHVVKREAVDAAAPGDSMQLPGLAAARWLETGDDEDVLRAIMQLPPPVPVADGGDGGALIALSLVRQWASSRAALESALRARLAQSQALLEAFAAGRYPTREQLRAWCYADGALQLALPQLASDNAIPDRLSIADDADRHAAALRALLGQLRGGVDPDDARAAALEGVLRAHSGSRIVVFAEFAATVKALYSRLMPRGEIAMLSGRGGFVAGGRVTRRELLAQFCPGTGAPGRPSRRVRMLITTDLLSEGVNLQEANVIVHADLPWSPARCEQRVGRVRRLASRHEEVFVYALRPPALADNLLRLQQRLRDKIAAASRAVGVQGTIMPRLFADPAADAPAALRDDSELTSALERWMRPTPKSTDPAPAVAAVVAPATGFIAAVDWGEGPAVVADVGSGISSAFDVVLPAVREAHGAAGGAPDELVQSTLARLAGWCDDRASMKPFDGTDTAQALARRRLIRRIDAIASRSPRYLRSRYAPMAREARRAATATFGAGAEEVLAELAEARMPDEAWLNAVRTFASLHSRGRRAEAPTIRALLLLVPTSSPAAADPP
jgi:superfamily II DNA or RNA helicase